jgi:hypothetical protein
VTIGDTLNGAAARTAMAAVTLCAADAVKLAEASKFTEAHAKQADCVKLSDGLATGVKIGIDVTDASAHAIDAAEAAGAKDYTSMISSVVQGLIKVVQIFKDMGLEIPVTVPGVN